MSGVKFMRYVLLAAASAFCQAYGPAWTKSGTITIGTTADWANYTGAAVTNFPTLVRLDSSVFKFSEAKAGGADLGFSDEANTKKLPFEIETWDAAKGKATVWVKVDNVAPNAKTKIKMFWGNAAATAESNGAGVFADYVGVWHLAEPAESSTAKDASGHGADGTTGTGDDKTVTANAAVVQVINTPLGLGRAYNRTANTDSLGFTRVDSAKVHLQSKSFTVSAWMKRDLLTHQGDFFVAQGTQDPSLGLRMGFDFRNKFGFGIDGGQDTSPFDPYTAATQTLDWHYWVGTLNSTTKEATIYMDGVKVTSHALNTQYLGRGFLDFGFAYGPSGEYYHPTGGLDEVRISTAVATADMIKLSYLNQNENQSLVGYPVPTTCTKVFDATGPGATVQEGTQITLAGTAKCAERVQWVKVVGNVETPVASDGTKLTFPSRVVGTTAEKYRFKAMYDGVWQQKDVSFTINESIAEPEFILKGVIHVDSTTFPGQEIPVAMVYADVTNKAKLATAPAVNWLFTITSDKMVLNTDYITLDHNGAKDTTDIYFQSSGSLHVKLCGENGGTPICRQIDVSDKAIAVRPQVRLNPRMLDLNGSQLTWKTDAIIKVWDLRGQLVYSHAGAKGEKVTLAPETAAALFSKDHVMKVFPTQSAGNRNK